MSLAGSFDRSLALAVLIRRGAVVVGAFALLAGVRSSDSPDFLLDTTLESVDLAFSESRDFTLDARLTAYDPDYADSNSFALDSRGVNRAWGDSEPFAVDDTGVPVTPDCNHNGKIDSRDIADRTSFDCNKNSVPDECDIRDGVSRDCVIVNGIPDECEGFGYWCPTQQDDQLQDGENTNFEKVTLDHLWQWDAVGHFVKPPTNTVTIDPSKPTYLLTHGWDGTLDGVPRAGGTACRDTEFAMSSIGCAIHTAWPEANLLAWDWKVGANPNKKCDFPDRMTLDIWNAFDLLSCQEPSGQYDTITDAWLSGMIAPEEGRRLSTKIISGNQAPARDWVQRNWQRVALRVRPKTPHDGWL